MVTFWLVKGKRWEQICFHFLLLLFKSANTGKVLLLCPPRCFVWCCFWAEWRINGAINNKRKYIFRYVLLNAATFKDVPPPATCLCLLQFSQHETNQRKLENLNQSKNHVLVQRRHSPIWWWPERCCLDCHGRWRPLGGKSSVINQNTSHNVRQ